MADRVVMVTGGSGFIGQHVVDLLAASGWRVISVDRRPSIVSATDRPAAGHLRYDVTQPPFRGLTRSVGPEVLVHLAACSGLAPFERDPAQGLCDNVVGTANVLEACLGAGVRKVVFASSAAVYGQAVTLPAAEGTPPRPSSAYGWTKLAGEQLVRRTSAEHGLASTVLRLANCYGPGQERQEQPGVVWAWLQAARQGAPLRIAGQGRPSRDFIYVRDVAEAVLAALDRGDGEVLNVSSGLETTLGQLAAAVCSLTGARLAVQAHRAPEGDILRSALDPGRAFERLGWKARTSLAQGLLRTWEHVVEAGLGNARPAVTA